MTSIGRITDPADSRLDDYRQLARPRQRDRVERREGRFIAEGPATIERLVASDHEVRSFLLSPAKSERMATFLGNTEAPIYVAERSVIEAVTGVDLHRGVLASASRRTPPDPETLIEASTAIAVAVGINDHENLGSLFRGALALGFDAMLLDDQTTDPYHRRAVRVSMGAVLSLPFARMVGWPNPIGRLHRAGFTTLALTPDPSARVMDDVGRPEKPCVIVGSEATGLDEVSLRRSSHRVRIPMFGAVDSLNVSHAAAIAFYTFGPRGDPIR